VKKGNAEVSKAKREIIIIQDGLAVSLLKDAGSFAFLFGLMSIGVHLESSAMQWIRGGIGFLWLISGPARNRVTYDIEGARKRLDELEEA
jgi:hypothetical protein